MNMIEDRDYSQPGRINFRLYKYLTNALDELKEHIKIGGYQECPHLIIFEDQAKLYASDYSSAYSYYLNEIENLDKRYGKTISLSVPSHIRRMQLLLNVFHDIGTLRLNERNSYPEANPVDDYSFDFFNYDTKNLDYKNNETLKKLSEFYYGELRKEYENRSDSLRKREAQRRAGRAYIFTMKYKEYEKNGFQKSDIKNIFGIDEIEQKIIDYWLNELLPYGISTSIFAKAGAGKSNFSAVICQFILIMKPQWDIITNLPFVFSPLMDIDHDFDEIKIDRFHFVISMSELLMETAKITLNNRIPSILLDEFDSALTTDQMRAQAGMNLRNYIYLERHWDTQGPLFVYHTRKDIPVVMREEIISHAVFMVTIYSNYLTRRSKRVLSNPDYWQNKPMGGRRYLPIPLTTLPYHSWGTSPFTVMDVDMKWLNAHVTGTKKSALKQILDLIPKREWDEKYQKKLRKERGDDE